ncbi:MAG: pantetheine-phosphate adenylyltransferase [Thaumarchaeota archaeon]|nr:pantetheine-phosphate adenylyltransferase [Nitrososphaerota archaeon]MBI3116411.1 pantetheine-phosphate adenylyltransferase [Nitrososphaerota archaeon]
MKKYGKVATGGTFDHIHIGHRRLLERSFEVGEMVVIGVTSDEFVREQGKRPDHTYEERASQLVDYLDKNFPGRKYVIARLYDFFGPGIASPDVQAIVVSPETVARVPLANRLRAEKGYPSLEMVTIEKVLAEDGQPVSSTRIRSGEIDTEGKLVRRKKVE